MIRARNVLTRRVGNIGRSHHLSLSLSLGSPGNTSTKRFPIFSLRKRIYPSAAGCLSSASALRRDGNVPCAPSSLRHPIISHDLIFTTRNTKLAFHLRELQFAASAHHLRPTRFSFRPFVSFHPLLVLFDSFRRSQPFGYFPICPRRPRTISALLRFRVSVRPPFSPTATRRRRFLSRLE